MKGTACLYKLLKLYSHAPERLQALCHRTFKNTWGVFICLFWVPQDLWLGIVIFWSPRTVELYQVFKFQIHTSTASLVFLLLHIRIKYEIPVSQSGGWIASRSPAASYNCRFGDFSPDFIIACVLKRPWNLHF